MAGFDVSYAFGKLTIGSIVVPNNAMKFQEDGKKQIFEPTMLIL